MIFIYIAIFAQFLFALVVLADKFLVTSKKAIQKPIVYAFYVSLLSGAVVIFIPLGIDFSPGLKILWLSVLSAAAFMPSLVFLYKALKTSDASDVAPVMGAISGLSAFGFGYLLLGDSLTGNFLAGFIMLVAGTALMSYFRFNFKTAFEIGAAGALLGLSLVFLKMVFAETDFLNGFFWSRMANFAGALILLFVPSVRAEIRGDVKRTSRGLKWFIVGSKVLAGVAFLFISIAIKLGNVSVVNALTGVQFVFVLLFALIFNNRLSRKGYMFETVHKKHVIGQKLLATLLIVGGMALLFI